MTGIFLTKNGLNYPLVRSKEKQATGRRLCVCVIESAQADGEGGSQRRLVTITMLPSAITPHHVTLTRTRTRERTLNHLSSRSKSHPNSLRLTEG